MQTTYILYVYLTFGASQTALDVHNSYCLKQNNFYLKRYLKYFSTKFYPDFLKLYE